MMAVDDCVTHSICTFLMAIWPKAATMQFCSRALQNIQILPIE